MTTGEHIPLAVLAFASRLPQLGPLPPRPCAWRELSGEWVVVFEDGRKLRFMKAAETPASISRPGEMGGASSTPAQLKKGKRK